MVRNPHVFTAEGAGSTPSQRTKIPGHGQKKKKKIPPTPFSNLMKISATSSLNFRQPWKSAWINRLPK